MTTPTEPGDPSVSPAAEPPDDVTTAPSATPTGPDPRWAPPGGYPGYPPQYGQPFAPTYREPWINPAKKRTAGLLATAAAIVFLGIGFLAGVGAGHRHDHGDRYLRTGPGMGAGMGRGIGPADGRGLPDRIRPGNRHPRPPAGRLPQWSPRTAPTPAPTPAPSSSHR